MGRYAVLEHVRWEDIDAAGIINYQAYLRLFALAEAEMLRACGLSYKELGEELGIWLPRVHVECDFFEPLLLDELVVVEAWFGRIGRTSIQVDFAVRRKARPEREVAVGRYVLVVVKQREFTALPVPPRLLERITPYLESAPVSPSRSRA